VIEQDSLDQHPVNPVDPVPRAQRPIICEANNDQRSWFKNSRCSAAIKIYVEPKMEGFARVFNLIHRSFPAIQTLEAVRPVVPGFGNQADGFFQ
jgi:hypothetical protein